MKPLLKMILTGNSDELKKMTSRHSLTIVIPLALLIAAALFGRTLYVPLQSAAAYIIIMLLPGAALALIGTRKTSLLDLLLFAFMLSPVVLTAVGALLILTGLSAHQTTFILVILFSITTLWTALSRHSINVEINLRQGLIFLAVLFLFFMMAEYMPLTHEWWRMRSDAWFHAAVVAQIDSYGLPPGDPYFAGLTLQYMWLYHVLVLLISKGAHIDPFAVMPLINLQAMAGFVLGTFLLSTRLKRSSNLFAYGLASVFVAVLGLNALFWIFLPIKALRAFTGTVRGWQEIANILSLSPLDIHTVRSFLRIYSNQVFFLDKFIVSTAFSLGIAYIAVLWYGAVGFLSKRDFSSLAKVAIAMLGLLFFHSAVGFIMIACFFASLILVHMVRESIEDYLPSLSIKIFLACLIAIMISSPYLYAIIHLKETGNIFPFGFSLNKTIGILISCALGLILAPFQFQKLLKEKSFAGAFTLTAMAVIFVFCQVIRLPGVNTLDKLPFFVFYPLSILGGWTLIDVSANWSFIKKSRALKVAGAILLFGPLNVVAIAGYYHTPTEDVLSSAEKEVTKWVRENTSRDAVFIDSDDRVFLLVSGSRRYYWGTDTYSRLWGYSSKEMAKRRHVRDNIYSSEALDNVTLRALGGVEEELFVIVRNNKRAQRGQESGSMVAYLGVSKFEKHPDIFHKSFSAGGLDVYRVNSHACLLEAERIEKHSRKNNQENL